MKITITKTVTLKEDVNFENLKVVRTNAKDVDSVNIEIYYNEEAIGYGHLNNRTNFAHITINENLLEEEDECELIDYLVDGIENRTISFF